MVARRVLGTIFVLAGGALFARMIHEFCMGVWWSMPFAAAPLTLVFLFYIYASTAILIGFALWMVWRGDR